MVKAYTSNIIRLLMLILALSLLVACEASDSGSGSSGQTVTNPDLRIISGSENRTLEPIIQAWANENNVTVQVDYQGSLDIMLDLEDGQTDYDAVWPANGIWITLGDQQRIVQHSESILRSPVVLGLRRSIAEELNWTNGAEVTVNDILEAAENAEFRLMMTSATQSNSGASAYLAFLYAFAGNPDVLTEEHLEDPDVAEQIKRILGTVDRSSGSSGWLKDLCLEQYFRCDAMINYEAVIIEANQELTEIGEEPLYAIYPADGLAIADSPLGFVDQGKEGTEDLFLQLQQHLLSDPVQNELLAFGRRTGNVGLSLENANSSVFNPDWGIDVEQIISPIRFPNADVIRQALVLYQTAFRKPSFTIYALDYSGSMFGEGNEQLTMAMETLLNQRLAQRYLLQASPDDITIVLLFNDGIINAATVDDWTVRGDDDGELGQLMNRIRNQEPGGGTDIYQPIEFALNIFDEVGIGNRFPAIILMTDGRSSGTIDQIRPTYLNEGGDIPVFSITFGDADPTQLNAIADLTVARVFDGSENLVDAFRQAKGYN